MKKILYIDMDGVLADYDSAAYGRSDEEKRASGFFYDLQPIPGAIEAVKNLHKSGLFEIYFLSTAPWSNPYAWSEKRLWLEKHFEEIAFKRLILSHNKGLLKGDYLVDDRIANGVANFEGYHVHFGSEDHPDWPTTEKFLIDIINYPIV